MPRRPSLLPLLLSLLALGPVACGPTEEEGPFVAEVVSFDPGPGAGYGASELPDVVMGPPEGGTTSKGSTHVVSLGRGGSIVLRLGQPIVDDDGPDLLVFENPFEVAGASGGGFGEVFAEPGEVSVSSDGETFTSFACAPDQPAGNGCAGFGLVHAGSVNDLDPTDPAVAGGDAFDLADIGVLEASYVRIVDRGTIEAPPSAGFDLDAVAVVAAKGRKLSE